MESLSMKSHKESFPAEESGIRLEDGGRFALTSKQANLSNLPPPNKALQLTAHSQLRMTSGSVWH
jgi:hypothetical protein